MSSFIQSLIDLNNQYRRQLLSSASALSHSRPNPVQPLLFSGNQLVFYNYFKEIVEKREQCLITGVSPIEFDMDWKQFSLVLGKPGTGKSYTMRQCIQFSIDNDPNTCAATPNGTLACTHKDLNRDTVTCDTIHGIFTFKY